MKWLVGLLIAGIIVFLTLGIIANRKYDVTRKARQTQEESQAPAAASQAVPGAANVQTAPAEANAAAEAANVPEESPTPLPEDDVTTGVARPMAASIIGTDKPARIKDAARQAGIHLAGIQTMPKGAFLDVTWTGDDENAGNKYLEALKKDSLITSYNLEISNVDYRFDKGQKLWTAKYAVNF